ncbi:fimbrial biogenesis chaperone [Dickeya dadantii]|uniref:fimbrial biogenesis chaperone n=1 Tax=Dickeya dadantii TaxID=204038 RepID=UPI001C0B8E1C|nr:molecular chaperone [Dickeya dadantii]QWT41587.1 molecular chaperone [Dickeya dadantii]
MKRATIILMAVFLFIPYASLASSSILVWPIYQTIEANQRGTTVWLENKSRQDTKLQIQVVAWNQENNHDVYRDQNDVIASPPFTTIPAGKRQLIRLMRLTTPPAGQQKAYRIIIDEVPDNLPADAGKNRGLQFRMRYVLPLFLYGEGISAEGETSNANPKAQVPQPSLSWQIRNTGGQTYLMISNSGKVHARLSNVFFKSGLVTGRAGSDVAKGFLGYVLPGKTMQWKIDRVPSSADNLYAVLTDNTSPVLIKKEK